MVGDCTPTIGGWTRRRLRLFTIPHKQMPVSQTHYGAEYGNELIRLALLKMARRIFAIAYGCNVDSIYH